MTDIRFPEKKVDEAWKQQIEEERARLEAATLARDTKSSKAPGDAKDAEAAGPATNKHFAGLLQMLAMQAYMALGEMESPATGALEINLPQAKAFIDLLTALQEKTKGNLSKEEEDSLNSLVYELQLKFTERKAGVR
ncbi:MAG: DUF1844 domain-containing protein [Candidatus Omnitrophica bacterium]|jgi:hypothetical protein|nr:DUF1844 domain-containing protein [Candidatus Omnitrophota bacterium]